MLELFGDRYNRGELFLRELPAWILIGLAALVLVALVMYARAIWREPRAPRKLLLTLRAAIAAVILAVLLGPSLELQRAARIAPRVAVLLDVSRSMSLPEGDGTRLDRALELVREATDQLDGDFAVELFTFDEELRPLERDALDDLTAGSSRTDIAAALAGLERENEDGALSGVLLVSDGADTARLGAPEDVSRRAGEWTRVPVYPLPAVDPEGFRDLALVNLRHDPFGFVRHELAFDVELHALGFDGAGAELVLRRDGAPLTTRSVIIDGDDAVVPLRFPLTPDRPGVYLFSIEARPLPGEVVQSNNRVEFAVTVGRDQLRVLMICGRPSWDERFLRHMLKKDPNVDLVSFFILRDHGDNPMLPQDELSLIPFPVNDLFTTELGNFDIVVLQNFDRRPFLSNLHLENLREFVVRDGGGLLLVGGDLGLSVGGYAGSAIEDILPFRLDTLGSDVDEASFQAQLTREGETHFITRLEPEAARTRAIYEGLPELDGTNLVGTLAGTGVALLTHPTQRVGGAPMPVLAARSAGRGRSLSLTVDTTWYWNFKSVGQGRTNRDYMRFWHNSIRWLSHDRSSKFLSLSVAEERVGPGEEMPLRVTAYRGDYTPLQGGRVQLTVSPAGAQGGETLQRGGLTDAAGQFRTAVSRRAEGFYRVRVELLDGRGDVVDQEEKIVEVRSDPVEVQDPALRLDLLRAIASVTGGRVVPAEQAGSVPIEPVEVFRLAERRRVDLWDNGVLFTLLVALLLGEWWLRRRAGLA